uniref:ENT domain-containing protein n=1 Tax=Panagrellus redivivus TaxID=6233 RepID=A0A7E4VWP9_PANRE
MEVTQASDRNDDNASGGVVEQVNTDPNSAPNTRVRVNPGLQARPIRARTALNKFSPEPTFSAPPKTTKAPRKPAPPVITAIEVKPEKPQTPVKNEPVIEAKNQKTIPNQDGGNKPPPSKRKVRRTRTAKPVGFYDDRFDCLQRRHQAAKSAILEMEDAAFKGHENCENVLLGSAVIETMFGPYAKALTLYKEAQTALRRTLLLERKLAAEVWGDNEIATFRNGVYTVDQEAIEATLTKAPTVAVREKSRSSSKRPLKPVKRLIDDEELNPPPKKRKIKSLVVEVKTETPEVSTPQKNRNRRKVVPTTMAEAVPLSPVNKIRLKMPLSFSAGSNSGIPVKSALPPADVKPTRKPKRKRTEKRHK